MPTRLDRHSRHARSVLLWGAGIYLALQVSAGLLLDYAWPMLRFPSARKRLDQLAAEPVRPTIVAFGSSRFQGGIVPTEVRTLVERQCCLEQPVGVFNASVPCGDVISAEFVLHKLIDAGTSPRLVLLEVSPETLNGYNEWLGMHVRRQIRWDEAPRYLFSVFRSLQGMRWFGERINPLYEHREELCLTAARALKIIPLWPESEVPSQAAWATSTRETDKPLDWSDLLRPPQRELPPGYAEISRAGADQPRRWLRNYRIRGGMSAEAMTRFLTFCKQRGIDVLLIGVPVTEPHRAMYTPEIDREYLTFMAEVTNQYGGRFVDYRDRVPDNLFNDNHHLAPPGGVYFSRLLTHELLVPYFLAH